VFITCVTHVRKGRIIIIMMIIRVIIFLLVSTISSSTRIRHLNEWPAIIISIIILSPQYLSNPLILSEDPSIVSTIIESYLSYLLRPLYILSVLTLHTLLYYFHQIYEITLAYFFIPLWLFYGVYAFTWIIWKCKRDRRLYNQPNFFSNDHCEDLLLHILCICTAIPGLILTITATLLIDGQTTSSIQILFLLTVYLLTFILIVGFNCMFVIYPASINQRHLF